VTHLACPKEMDKDPLNALNLHIYDMKTNRVKDQNGGSKIA
jgi:hypothetical protein